MIYILQSIQNFLNEILWIETIAVLASVLYVYLATKEKLWCWFFSLISVVLYIVINIQNNLTGQAFLQMYYGVMTFYGFYTWKKNRISKNNQNMVFKMSFKMHVIVLIGILIFGMSLGFILYFYFENKMPFIDGVITMGAIITTWLFAKKYLENWIYWIAIDSASAFLYFESKLNFTVLLFVFYIILSVKGFVNWRKTLRINRERVKELNLI